MSAPRTRTLDIRSRDERADGFGLEIAAPDAPEPTPLSPGSTIIGRGDDVDLQVVGDGVSRRHVKLLVRGNSGVQIIDLGSHNGTFVNGAKVEVGELSIGDEMKIGTVVMRLVPVRGDSPEPAPTPAVATQLRPRELEVATLVAKGMTNAQVGAQLHISARTVGRHLANIYERLQIHSRAALAKSIGELEARGDSEP